jgi:hypothetical protein
MLTESLAQLRFAASILFGLSFDVGSLDRLVAALRETRREFGTIGTGGELVGGPALDDESRRMMQLRRFRSQARRAAHETAFYGPLFDRLGLDPGTLGWDDLARIPPTTREALRADPDACVRRSANPVWRCTTTGTTGAATTIYFSADEMRAFSALSAISLLMAGTVGEDDVVQISTSARALLGNTCFAGACTRVGAPVHQAGLVDPAHTLALLAEPRRMPGKKDRVSVLIPPPQGPQLAEACLAQLVGRGRSEHAQTSDLVQVLGVLGHLLATQLLDGGACQNAQAGQLDGVGTHGRLLA